MALVYIEVIYATQKTQTGLPAIKALLSLRQHAWSHHYGVPTIAFLISFEPFIQASTALDIDALHAFIDNHCRLDPHHLIFVAKQIEINQTPATDEEGRFITTLNQYGYMTTQLDPISEHYIRYCAEHDLANHTFLEIGAAYGIATLATLTKIQQACLLSNDLDAHQLNAIKTEVETRHLRTSTTQTLTDSSTADYLQTNTHAGYLQLLPGNFQHELVIAENTLDAILICRVLHFLNGTDLDRALLQLKKWLVPGGKLFVVVETPFMKNWSTFLPVFQQRKDQGDEYPGQIEHPTDYEAFRTKTCPSFLHFMDKAILSHALSKAGFQIEHIDYIDRKNTFPEDMLLDGRESVGAIAIKTGA